ncbi:putative quinol monooxygenase [Gilvibacter sediminis]|uniref:putative quinol monooxygenase n=1 Tax=Gilvibacter sediminis TaxID=379071 RepID=UPI0023508C7B|nr:putative quinol monooxygenase [Gilvibacter sediminis]MDC7996537.1 putative quinol monooxygenase [Gilvibacter sediminis]
MTKRLTIVAQIIAKPEKRELVKSELQKLIPITRKEQGCINYDLHQDLGDPNMFLFYENWESRELWQNHMNNSHLGAYLQATEGAVASFVLHEMQAVD